MTNQRHRQILAQLHTEEEVTVRTLAERLGTSEITIRRDLNQLADAGKLVRTHGGALLPDGASFVGKSERHSAEKTYIGELAAHFVEEGDTLFLDCGSTVLALAPHLKKFRNLKIITNSLPVLSVLLEAPHLSINLIGGELDPHRRAVHGAVALEHIARYHADKAFIGTDGLSLANGLSAQSETEASLSRALIDHASLTFLLADAGKFERNSYLRYAPLSAVHRILTDKGLDESLHRQYTDAGHIVVSGI